MGGEESVWDHWVGVSGVLLLASGRGDWRRRGEMGRGRGEAVNQRD